MSAQNPILNLTQKELERQKNTLNLIASENYPSPKVLQLLGAVWSNKYGEGNPGKRYYAGNEFTDQVELLAMEKALKVFDKTGEYGANLQVLSGSPANRTVFLATLEKDDVVLSPDLASGGHLTHMHSVSVMRKFVTPELYYAQTKANGNFEIDFENLKQKIETLKPKLLILGYSSYPSQYKFAEICKFAHQHETLVLADVAHINGLIAAGLHDSPFKAGDEGADFITMTTHKTFRGPRSAMLFAKNYLPKWAQKYTGAFMKNAKGKEVSSLIEAIDRAIFPGGFGGPHFNKIAATAQACLEILGEDFYPDKVDFKTYSQKTMDNCKALENSLLENGLEIVSPTQNHLCLAKLPTESDSLKIQKDLEKIGIITNRNVIPNDPKTAWKPSGIRLGTAALTSRGLNFEQSKILGKIIADLVFERKSQESLESEVKELVAQMSWWL